MNTPKPPKKLSALVRLARRDYEAVVKNPAYAIDTNEWHQPGGDGRCRVCLAGAVMAQTLGVSPTDFARPGNLEDNCWFWPLLALDSIREGNLKYALTTLGSIEDDYENLEFIELWEIEHPPIDDDLPRYLFEVEIFLKGLGL